MITTMKYLGRVPPAEALSLIRNSIPALRADWEINKKAGTFRDWVGEELTFEEFLCMMLTDRKLHELKQEIDRRG